MNISTFPIRTYTGSKNSSGTIFAGNLFMRQNAGLKSTQQKLERQQEAAGQIEFWEKQKENLKNMSCDTIEEIARKLDKFHTYEEEIAAVKTAYNNEQMWHAMDEVKEQAEKIAEAAEDSKPKTPEERREEAVEEALGIEEGEGILEEVAEEMEEVTEEMQEQLEEMQPEELTEKSTEEIIKTQVAETAKQQQEMEAEQKENIVAKAVLQRRLEEEWLKTKTYKGVDIRV